MVVMIVTYGKDRKGHCKGDDGDVSARDAVWSIWMKLILKPIFVFENLNLSHSMIFSIKPTQRIRNCCSLIPLNCREVTSASFLSPLSNDSIPDLDSHLISVVKTLSWEVDGNTVRLTV